MDSTLSLCKAIDIATNCHREQVDLSGQPYMLHVLHVAASVNTLEEKIVALLHDVMEDGNIQRAYLEKFFDPEIVDAVDILTRRDGQDYQEYIMSVAKNKLARTVKLADLTHNMDIRRLDSLSHSDFVRMSRYQVAYQYLIEHGEESH